MRTTPSGAVADVRALQAPLRARYRQAPETAWIVDEARTSGERLHDPLHGRVRAGAPVGTGGADIDFAVHDVLGGLHDAPVPGDLLCAALASCQESSLRMVANVYGVVIESLSVQVQAEVDVRGTLGMDPKVPVAFQAMRVKVQLRAAPGTPPERVQQMCKAAERSCVVMQTLRSGVAVSLTLEDGSA
jgi:uncharacterized OsmC-like protein